MPASLGLRNTEVLILSQEHNRNFACMLALKPDNDHIVPIPRGKENKKTRRAYPVCRIARLVMESWLMGIVMSMVR